MEDFNHPGSNFILEKIKSSDVTKYVSGKKKLIFYDLTRNKFQLIKHKHDFRFDKIILKKCIGPVT